MRITKHEKSYIVELSDHSAWRILRFPTKPPSQTEMMALGIPR